MGTMKARLSIDLAIAAAEDAFQSRDVLKNKRKTAAAARVHQRAFDHRRGPASNTFHSVKMYESSENRSIAYPTGKSENGSLDRGPVLGMKNLLKRRHGCYCLSSFGLPYYLNIQEMYSDMKYVFAASAATLILALSSFAQTPPCPTVRVTSPDTVKVGESATYSVNVTGGDRNVTPTYNWTVSDGMISSGQGTSVIVVDTKGASGGSITATVDLMGFDRSCSTASSSTTSIAAAVEARMYDSMMSTNAQPRFDNLAIELQNSPTDKVYIVAYGGRRSYKGEAEASLKRAKDYLVKKGIAAGRIVTIDGGYRDDAWRETWIVPEGAAPPQASPYVDPSEVTMGPAPGAKKAAPKKAVKKKKA